MYVFVVGSIQMDVPVNPVCPKEPTGSSAPRLLESCESMSQPSPRRTVALGGCAGRGHLLHHQRRKDLRSIHQRGGKL